MPSQTPGAHLGADTNPDTIPLRLKARTRLSENTTCDGHDHSICAEKKKKPKGKEGTTRAVAANVIRPETAPLAVGLWSKMEKRWAISLPSSFRVSRHLRL